MPKFIKKIDSLEDQRGDTIVEVIIAIAVASLVLTSAFVTVNKNNQTTQLTAERTQAVKLVESQIELLRAAKTVPNNYCFEGGSSTTHNPKQSTDTACIVDQSGNPAGTSQPAFNLKITSVPTSPTVPAGTYEASATWDNFSGGKNSVSLAYRTYER